MQLNSLSDLFSLELNDLYDTERRNIEVLAQLEFSATAPELKHAFANHLRETKTQLARLDAIFGQLETIPSHDISVAMEGLAKDCEQIMEADAEAHVRDSALAAAMQRIEHYEISGYGTARALADQLGLAEIADLLQRSLEEEIEADEELTKLATGGFVFRGLNQAAAEATLPIAGIR